jgi:hypothetical protein
MVRFLTGMTHALVYVPSKEDVNGTGIRATVSLCFGPGDENAITNIHYVRSDGGLFWEVPHISTTRNGRPVKSPVFTGELLEKLCQAAARALERVKQQIGTPDWDTTYRVFGRPDGTPIVEVVAK